MTASPPATIGVFICGSDNRRDVLQRVLPSILKYWPDCPYPIYVGANSRFGLSPRITALIARPSGWRQECLDQVEQLSETHLIVVLDDFLFRAPVIQSRLSLIVSDSLGMDCAYVRLRPLGKSLKERLVDLVRGHSALRVESIEGTRRFYSSLQIALWKREHFLSLLRAEGTIWDFEHQQIAGVPHFAVTKSGPFRYSHLVEKGRWQPYAKALLIRAGLSGDLGKRRVWSKWTSLRLWLDEMRFYLIGYSNH